MFVLQTVIKITKPELFRIALKFILVGTGNVLSPHKYFRFERSRKIGFVNSENAFMVMVGSWLSTNIFPRSFGMTWIFGYAHPTHCFSYK